MLTVMIFDSGHKEMNQPGYGKNIANIIKERGKENQHETRNLGNVEVDNVASDIEKTVQDEAHHVGLSQLFLNSFGEKVSEEDKDIAIKVLFVPYPKHSVEANINNSLDEDINRSPQLKQIDRILRKHRPSVVISSIASYKAFKQESKGGSVEVDAIEYRLGELTNRYGISVIKALPNEFEDSNIGANVDNLTGSNNILGVAGLNSGSADVDENKQELKSQNDIIRPAVGSDDFVTGGLNSIALTTENDGNSFATPQFAGRLMAWALKAAKNGEAEGGVSLTVRYAMLLIVNNLQKSGYINNNFKLQQAAKAAKDSIAREAKAEANRIDKNISLKVAREEEKRGQSLEQSERDKIDDRNSVNNVSNLGEIGSIIQ